VVSEQQICLGVIIGARGVNGEVRIKTFTETPEDITAYGPLRNESGQRVFEITDVRVIKGQASVIIEGVADRDAAEALKGIELYISRAELPDTDDDEYYHNDLIGLAVLGQGGEAIGNVKALYNFGAGDVIEIERPEDTDVLLPFNAEIVTKVDIKAGNIVVDIPEDLLESGNSKTKARKERRKRQKT
jgi:16S rRNA processing protein RimM